MRPVSEAAREVQGYPTSPGGLIRTINCTRVSQSDGLVLQLALNRHAGTSLSQASMTLLHNWNPNDWLMPLANGFFLSKYEAQTFKNPVLKYLPQGPPKSGDNVREQDSQDPRQLPFYTSEKPLPFS